jgi:hypothetical protein
MKRWTSPLLLAIALITAAVLLRGRGRLPETPEDAVSALFDAAERGDAAGYLRLLSGDLKTSVESTRSQLGSEGFAENLRLSVRGIKSFAISRAGSAPPDTAALEVELVFVDRNELQRFVLVQQNGGWAITALDKAQMRKPPVPYGTPVFEEGRGEGTEGPRDKGK